MAGSNDSDPVRSGLAAEMRGVLGALVRRLREQTAGSDLTRSQSSVLARLEREGGATSATLARLEGIRPQSVSAITAVLEKASLVSGTPDPDDRRKTIWNLTERAREDFRSGRRAREDWLSNVIHSTLTAEETTELASAIDLLRRLASAP